MNAPASIDRFEWLRTPSVQIAAVVLGACASLALLVWAAPDYLRSRGFPLDDAWIHAVYGRSIAQSFAFHYNPGVPASGETAPLWGLVVALPHLLTADTRTIAFLIKAIGFTLHVASSVVCWQALARARASTIVPLCGALLVAVCPELVAASVSGMEVPLATLAIALLWREAVAPRWPVVAGFTALAILARPELGLVAFGLPFLMYVLRDHARLRRALGGAIVGSVIAFSVIVAISMAGSGRPLPATFYAKAGAGITLHSEWLGFTALLPELPPFGSVLLLPALAAVAAVMLWRSGDESMRSASAGLWTGVAFCAASFALIVPFDPLAFYHQRYVLPAMLLMLPMLPTVIEAGCRRWVPSAMARVTYGLSAALVLVLALGGPSRYRRLDNDAHNIDDVQVRMGQALASADPNDVVWAIDAGAVRYFGRAFVVDMMGLNSPRMLGSEAATFLDEHPPRYLDIFADLSDQRGLAPGPSVTFTPTTQYSVTSNSDMRAHVLVTCPPGAPPFQFRVRSRVWPVQCQ